jgi:hypothetical protein
MFNCRLRNADFGLRIERQLRAFFNPQSEIRIPQSSDFYITGAAISAPLGVERSAIAATVVHLAREPVGDESAQDENAAQNGYGQQRIPQPLYFSLKLR